MIGISLSTQIIWLINTDKEYRWCIEELRYIVKLNALFSQVYVAVEVLMALIP